MSFFAGKKVLVTGATGFVGGHLTHKLLELGAEVSVLVRQSSSPQTVAVLEKKGARVIYGDVSDRGSVFEALRNQQYVFHIAALFRQAKFPEKVYYDVNVEGTRNVLDAAEELGVNRVIHCSTVGVHSHISSPPANEEEDYRPGDIYQHTKCEGEKLAQERFRSGRVPGVVVRPAMIWGDGDRRMLKLFRGVAKRRFPIIGNGKTLTHWVYVHDLVNGFLLAAEKEAALGQTYIFAGQEPVSISKLVETVAKAAGVKPLPFKVPARPVQLLGSFMELVCKPFGVEPPIYRRRVDFFTKDRSFDTTKAQTELGYRPENDFEQEVEKIYGWYKEHGWLSKHDNKPARITLLGSNSGRNAGDAAILASIMKSLSEAIKREVIFEVPTTNPKFVKENYGGLFNVRPVSVMPWTGSIRLLGLPTALCIRRSDLVLITDGIIFDVRLFNPLFNFLITLVFLVPWARFCGTKVVCYNVGIGPLKSRWGRLFARRVGEACDLIMVRDEDSLQLFRDIGVTKEIHLTADSVFTNWSSTEKRAFEILEKMGVAEAARENRLLGVNVTRYMDQWLRDDEKLKTRDGFLPMLASVLVRLRLEHGICPIIFITQIMDTAYGQKLQELVCEQSEDNFKPPVLTNAEYSNHDLIAVASEFRLLVGMRVHSLIMTARSGTPVVGMVYAPKVRSFLKQLQTPDYSFELLGINKEKLTEDLLKAWENSEALCQGQQAVVRTLAERAKNAAVMFSERYYNAPNDSTKLSENRVAMNQ